MPLRLPDDLKATISDEMCHENTINFTAKLTVKLTAD